MKNREKFRDEIVEAIKDDNRENQKMCYFMTDNVIPRFVSEEDMERRVCSDLACHTCTKMFAFWLDEEYEEPPKPEVDWHNVPVDALVRVRDFEDDEWVLRYFSKYRKDDELRYATFYLGTTSVTAKGSVEYWKYCELVEDEDE